MPHRIGRIGGIVLLALASLATHRLLAQSDAAADPQWTTDWPALGDAASLLLDPANPLRLFAGTERGLATTLDGGQSWSLQPGTPHVLRTLALDPSNPSRLVGGSNDGVFVSDDAGAHFTLVNAEATVAIAVDPSHSHTMYSAGLGSEVFRSLNGGATWSSSAVTAPLTSSIAALIVDPRNSDRVFAGIGAWNDLYSYSYSYSYYDGPPSYAGSASLVGSSDGGHTWRIFLDNATAAKPVRALAFDPRTSQVMYAGYGPYVYRTGNGGITWAPGTVALGSVVTSLVVDSMNPDTVYAGSDQGVFRSTDAGAHWAPLPTLPNADIRAIALDSAGQLLHAATRWGVYELGLGAETPTSPCRPAADTLCLLGSHFQVRVRARDPHTGRTVTGHAVGQGDVFGYFSLPDLTGDRSLPEILVKMVDAETPPWNGDWVFYAGLTDLPYVVTVTDTRTGEVRTYQNDPSSPYCGGADTAAFPSAAAASDPPRAIPLAAARTAPSDGGVLTLLLGRFQVGLVAKDPNTGLEFAGQPVGTDDRFGYFSFPNLTGDPRLAEVFVKMIDARILSDTFWIFGVSLTSLDVRLELTDVISGTTRTYPLPGRFCGFADTSLPDSGSPFDGYGANRTYTVSGVVRDASGAVKAAGAWIDLSPGVQRRAWTSPDGRFSIDGVPPGRWTVHAGAGVESGSAEVQVPPSVADVAIWVSDTGD